MAGVPMSDERLLERVAALLVDQGRAEAAGFVSSVRYLRREHVNWESGAHDAVVLFVPPETYRVWADAESARRYDDRDSLPNVVENAARKISAEYDPDQRHIMHVRALPTDPHPDPGWRDRLAPPASTPKPTRKPAPAPTPVPAPAPRRPMDAATRALVARLIEVFERDPERFGAELARAALLPEWEREKLRQALEILFGSSTPSEGVSGRPGSN